VEIFTRWGWSPSWLLSPRNILTKATIKKERNNDQMITMLADVLKKEKDKVAGVHRIV
jgi:hypothetical protein